VNKSSIPPDRSDLEGTVARALEMARRRLGLTQEEMVQALSPYQSRPAKHQQRWHDWVNRPTSVSSLALIAAATMARISLEDLLMGADAMPPASRLSWMEEIDDRIARLERESASMMDITRRLQESVEVQGDLLRQLAGGRTTTSEAPTTPSDTRAEGKARR
jgi:hypothetical protein